MEEKTDSIDRSEPSETNPPHKASRVSRRKFLIGGGLSLAASLFGINKLQDHSTQKPLEKSLENTKTGAIEVENSILKLGTETEISLQPKGLWDVPDERIPYVTLSNNERVYFLPGRAASYTIRGHKDKDPVTLLKDPAVQIEQAIGPDRSKPYKNGYCTINNVFQPDSSNLNYLLAITENEQHQELSNGELNWQKFTASIGWAESQDGGQTWEDRGQIIKGHEALPPAQTPSGLAVTGAGQPSSIIKDGYLYIYHIDWPAQIKVKHPYQIFLARCKVEKSGLDSIDSNMEYWTKDGFRQNAIPAEQVAVIKPPSSIDQGSQAALPSISFNKTLGQFLAVYETQFGFCVTKSEDGIIWSDGEEILRFPQPQYPHHPGDIWYSYPTLISPSEDTDTETNDKGYLICSKGVWGLQPHQPTARSFDLK